MKRVLICTALTLFPLAVLARTYGTDALNYTDVSADANGAVAISTLTEIGIVQGNPDGTFRSNALLNRAEFTKIVMGLVPDDGTPYSRGCFADVPSSVWYADPVCRAKALGIVSGNALADVSPEEWPFAATRNVNFAEAVKILVEIYKLPLRMERGGEDWYVRYFEAALPALGEDEYFDLAHANFSSAAVAGKPLSRWEMARLTVLFLANDEGTLQDYWAAEDGRQVSSSAASQRSSVSSSAVSVSSVSSEASSSVASSVEYDSDSDVSQYTNFLQLGDSSTQVLAAVNVFSDAEPLLLNSITVTLNTSASSVDALLLYDSFGRYLGRASRNTSTTYTASVKSSNVTIPKREDYSFYVRAQMKPFNSGGVSGQKFRVASVTVEGDGEWSNNSYTKTSSDTFPEFQTARSMITSIEREGPAKEPLVGGDDVLIGAYRFEGEKGDGSADLELTDLTFRISTVGGVTLSNPELNLQGINVRHSCSVSSSTITCSSLPDYIGSFEDRPIVLELHADVTVPADAPKAALGVNINQPGTPSSAGAVTWTDGSTSFTWVPFGSPVVRGTYYEQ